MYAKYFNYFAYLAVILIIIYLSLFVTMKELQTDFHYVILTLIFILFAVGIITRIYKYYVSRYNEKVARTIVRFPIEIVASLFVFFAIGKIAYDTLRAKDAADKVDRLKLSDYTHTVVVDQWEGDSMHARELDTQYKRIFSYSVGNNGKFLSKEQWDRLNLNVPYVSYEGNEVSWHYAARMIQEKVNIVRMNELQKKYRLNNEEDLKKTTRGRFGGWFTGFRMWMQDPIVRNVWEQYKYRHVNPEYSAWVEYYIVQPIDKDPEFWKKHRINWDNDMKSFLPSYKPKPKNL